MLILTTLDELGIKYAENWGKAVSQNINDQNISILYSTDTLSNIVQLRVDGDGEGQNITLDMLLQEFTQCGSDDLSQQSITELAEAEASKEAAYSSKDFSRSECENHASSDCAPCTDINGQALPQSNVGEESQSETEAAGNSAVDDNSQCADNLEFPAPSTEFFANGLTERVKIDEHDLHNAIKWLADGKIAEGLILLRSVEGIKVEESNLYVLFAAAFGDPMLRYALKEPDKEQDYANLLGFFRKPAQEDTLTSNLIRLNRSIN